MSKEKEHVMIHGIDPLKEIPKEVEKSGAKEVSIAEFFAIPSNYAAAECIVEMNVEVELEKPKLICNALGERLLVKGVIHYYVKYKVEKKHNCIEEIHFCKPFCEILGEVCCDIDGVFTAIESACVKLVNCRKIQVCVLVFLAPVCEKKEIPCEEPNPYLCDDECECKEEKDCHNPCKTKYHCPPRHRHPHHCHPRKWGK